MDKAPGAGADALGGADGMGSAGGAGAGGTKSTGEQRPPQHVMTWVPPWGIEPAKAVLTRKYADLAVSSVVDRIGLQFWTVRGDGSVEMLPPATEDAARWFVARAHESQIKVLATVVNDGEKDFGESNFHWEVTRKALDAGIPKVVEALLAVVERYELDGVDLDLEGAGLGAPFTEKDRQQYRELVHAMGSALHARNKLLTIDSYATNITSGIPKPLWWSDWVGQVDAIHAMGYATTYRGAPGAQSYEAIQAHALTQGYRSDQLLIGMPVWLDAWAGDESNTGPSHATNLKHVAHCLPQPSGVALWALNHPAGDPIRGTTRRPWDSEEPWRVLAELRAGVSVDSSLCDQARPHTSLIDDMTNAGLTLLGGQWSATTDYWARPQTERKPSSRVLTLDGKYDLSLGEGLWGDIKRGYVEIAPGKRGLGGIVRTIALNGASPAAAGFRMEFLPRDCSKLPPDDDGCGWKPEASVDQNLSGKSKLVVGIACDAGKQVRLSLQGRDGALRYEPPFGKTFACTGEFVDYEMVFSELEMLDTGLKGFDPTYTMVLLIDYVDAAPPSELSVKIAGIAVDHSVLELRGLK